MKLRKKILLLIIISISIIACEKKTLPEDTIESPVFFINGTISGEPFLLSAGSSNVVVSTDYYASYSGVPVFNTRFHDIACADCQDKLEFIISGDNSQTFESKLPLSDYNVIDYIGVMNEANDLSITTTDIIIDGLTNNAGEDFSIIDGHVPNIADGQYVYSYISDELNCPHSYSNGFEIIDGQFCGTSIEISISEGLFSFSAPTTDNSLDHTYSVIINGSPQSILPNEAVTISSIISSSEVLETITIKDLTDGMCYNENSWIFPGFTPSDCTLLTILDVSNDIAFIETLSVRVKYISDDGLEYHSIEETTASNMSIENIEEYGADPQGREAYRINISGTIILENINNSDDQKTLVFYDTYLPVVNE